MNKTIQLLVLAAFVVSAFLFTGCNATRGLGQDIENLGKSMQK